MFLEDYLSTCHIFKSKINFHLSYNQYANNLDTKIKNNYFLKKIQQICCPFEFKTMQVEDIT